MLELTSRVKLDRETIRSANLAGKLTEEDRAALGDWVLAGFNADEGTRQPWYKRNEAAMGLAMQIVSAKSFPWPGASNVAFPLVTIATLQFHSRAYPVLVEGPDIVQYRTVGDDPNGEQAARALRVGQHMSYQLLEEDQDWEEQHDRLLINVPIVGCAFKKTYQSGEKGRPESDLVLAQDLVLDYYAKSVETARRKTHILRRYRNDIHSAVKRGLYRNVLEESWYCQTPSGAGSDPKVQPRDDRAVPQPDDSTPFLLLEQHCWFDWDGDGYEEPYIVTVEKESMEVLRVVSRVDREEDVHRNLDGDIYDVTPTEYFTKYGFIPSPDGGIYDMGYGVLLGPLNESVNTAVNQIFDAGTMAMTSGGFIGRGVKIRGGAYTFAPMEWKRVDSTGDDLNKNIVPLPVREPSAVTLQLLSLLIQYTDRIAGSTEAALGENLGQNMKTGTANQMLEQGLKVFAAIFKRIWRSQREEFKKVYVLNAKHLSGTGAYGATREDYLGNPDRIAPVADPNILSDSMRIFQAQAIAQRALMVSGYDVPAVEKNLLRNMRVQGWETLYKGPDKVPPLPNPKLIVEQAKQQPKMLQLRQQQQEFVVEMLEQQKLNNAKIAQLEAQAVSLRAQAGVTAQNSQIQAFNAMIGALKQHNDVLDARIGRALELMEMQNGQAADGGGSSGVAQPPGNSGGAPMAGAGGAPAANGLGLGSVS